MLQYRERVFRLPPVDSLAIEVTIRRWDVDHAYGIDAAATSRASLKRVAMRAEVGVSYTRGVTAADVDTVYSYHTEQRADTRAAGAAGSEAAALAVDAIVHALMRDVAFMAAALRMKPEPSNGREVPP